MASAGSQIADDVAAALAEAGVATGSDAKLTATITRAAPLPDNFWDAPAGSEQTWTVTVIVSEFKREHVDGESILMTDKRILADALTVRPQPADTITIGSNTYTIMQVWPLEPAGVPLMYTIQGRA